MNCNMYMLANTSDLCLVQYIIINVHSRSVIFVCQ